MRKALIKLLALLAVVGGVGAAGATDYYWRSEVSTGNWADGDNWSTDSASGASCGTYPKSTTEDTAIFNSAAEVTVTSDANTCALTLNAEVTLHSKTKPTWSGNDCTGEYLFVSNMTAGTNGKLILSNAKLRSNNSKTSSDWAAPIEILGATTNCFYLNTFGVNMRGALSGSGTLYTAIYTQGVGVNFSGDNKNFTGAFESKVHSGAARDSNKFSSTSAVSVSAKYTMTGYYKNYWDNSMFVSGTSTSTNVYKFGELNGGVYAGGYYGSSSKGLQYAVIEVGELSKEDMTLGGNMGGQKEKSYGAGTTLRKRGSKKLTWTSCGMDYNKNYSGLLADLEIYGGTVELKGSDGCDNALPKSGYAIRFLGEGATLQLPEGVDPSTNICDSTSAILFDDRGKDATWYKALAASNAEGLTKDGTGTLTLDEVPAWTSGTITVLDGKVVIKSASCDNCTAGTGTKKVPDTTAGTTTFSPSAQATVSFANGEHYNLGVTVNGSAITTDTWVDVGETLVITATPASGYTITSILVNGTEIEGNEYTIATDDKARGVTITATAELIYAKIGDTAYTSFADAVEEAKSGDAIVLCQNVELTASVVLKTGVAMDFTAASLTTKTDGVYVTYDDNIHGLKYTTSEGVTTFSSEIGYNPTTYVWVGESTSANWTDSGNWQLAGAASAAPASDSVYVYIPSGDALTLTFAENDRLGILMMDRNVTLTGGPVYIANISGTGDLTLKDVTLYSNGGANRTFNVDLITSGTVNIGKRNTDVDSQITLNGDFSGDGDVTFYFDDGDDGFVFNGDTSKFSGSYTGGMRDNGDRDGTRFNCAAAVGSKLAKWTLGVGAKSRAALSIYRLAGTYYHGQLTSPTQRNVTINTDGVTLEVGHLAGLTNTFRGTLYYAANVLRKVGETSVLHVYPGGDNQRNGTIEIQEGEVTLVSDSYSTVTNAPAVKMTGKTAELVALTSLGITPTCEVSGYVLHSVPDTKAGTTTYTLISPLQIIVR